MHLLLSPGHHLGQHTWAHRSLRLGQPAKAAQEVRGQVRVLALQGQHLCHLLPGQAWVPPEPEAAHELRSISEVSAEWCHEASPSWVAESSQGPQGLQPALQQTPAALTEGHTATSSALGEKHLEEEEIRDRCTPSSPEEFGVLWVPPALLSVVRAEGKAVSGREGGGSLCVPAASTSAQGTAAKGKTVPPSSQRSVLELNCAFLDQARVVLEQHQLDCALEPSAGAQPGVLGRAGPGSTEPDTALGCSAWSCASLAHPEGFGHSLQPGRSCLSPSPPLHYFLLSVSAHGQGSQFVLEFIPSAPGAS